MRINKYVCNTCGKESIDNIGWINVITENVWILKKDGDDEIRLTLKELTETDEQGEAQFCSPKCLAECLTIKVEGENNGGTGNDNSRTTEIKPRKRGRPRKSSINPV